MSDPGATIRRILIALDSSVSTPESLEVATELARRLRAELEGLFVEDDALFKLAGLPFTRQINLSTGGQQPLDAAELERQMAGLASAARRNLARIAERDRVAWSFRTVRGRIAQEIAVAAETADLVIVEGGHRDGPAYARLGLPASATVKRVTRSVLILRAGRRFEGPVFVVFDGSPQAEKALGMAATLSRNVNPLTVLLPAGQPQDSLESKVRALLGNAVTELSFESYTAETVNGLCAHLGDRESGLLVLGADSPLLPAGDVGSLLDSITCTVLLVR